MTKQFFRSAQFVRSARYKGYTAMTYGKSSLSVCAPDGTEMFHTGARNQEQYTEAELVQIIKNVITLLQDTSADEVTPAI